MKINLLSILLIIILLSVAWFHVHSVRILKNKVKNAQNIITLQQNNPITYKVNKDSTISAYTETITSLKSNIKSLEGNNKALTDKVKLKDLQYLAAIKQHVKDTFITYIKDSIRHIDSLHIEVIKYFDFTDTYLQEHCEIDDSGEVICNYEYNDSVTVLVSLIKDHKWYQFWKWFHSKKSITEVIFANPKSKAIKVQSIIIE